MNKSWNREVINLELKQTLIFVVTFLKQCYFLYFEGFSSVTNFKSNAHAGDFQYKKCSLWEENTMFVCVNWTDTFIVNGNKQIFGKFSPVPNPKLYL
jgi:hypothetical protein